MRVLLDHCVPRRFRRLLVGHEVRTTFEMGWADLSTGALLARARESFGVFVPVDQNLQFQQNLMALPLPVMVLAAPVRLSPPTLRCCCASWSSRWRANWSVSSRRSESCVCPFGLWSPEPGHGSVRSNSYSLCFEALAVGGELRSASSFYQRSLKPC